MNLDKIPKELKELNQWVCSWDRSKAPMQSDINIAASSTNPQTWSTFNNACMAVETNTYDYVGFVFNDNGIVGIDIDSGYGDDGFLSPLACDIIQEAGIKTIPKKKKLKKAKRCLRRPYK